MCEKYNRFRLDLHYAVISKWQNIPTREGYGQVSKYEAIILRFVYAPTLFHLNAIHFCNQFALRP